MSPLGEPGLWQHYMLQCGQPSVMSGSPCCVVLSDIPTEGIGYECAGGWLVAKYGMRVGFYGYLVLVAVGLVPAVLAPVQVNAPLVRPSATLLSGMLMQSQLR